MQSLRGCVRIVLQKQSGSASMSTRFYSLSDSTALSLVDRSFVKFSACSNGSSNIRFFGSIPQSFSHSSVSAEGECKTSFLRSPFIMSPFSTRHLAKGVQSTESPSPASSASNVNLPTRIKFKRPDKTAKHIMQILDREAVEEVKKQREIPDIRPGYIVQLKVEVPENKRRVSVLKGIVIARRNAGLNTTFRIRRLVAGVGVESLFPLYSPNIKEIKVLDKKKVRRAKLYYLRDKMNALKKQ